MAEMFGGRIAKHCINCKFSYYDGEVGYDCKEKSFPKVCPKYKVDEKYVLEDVNRFIKYCKEEET